MFERLVENALDFLTKAIEDLNGALDHLFGN